MKTFNLTRVTLHDRKYHVFLTWGKSFEFSRKKTASVFLSDTNRFLTGFLVELNDCYCEMSVRYRKNWLLFFHNKRSHSFDNYQDERACDSSLEAVKSLLSIAFERHNSTNGSNIAFENFKKCIDYLIRTCDVLRKYYKRRSETVDVWQMDIFLSKLQSHKQDLEKWGVDSTHTLQSKMTVAFQAVIPLSFQTKSVN